MIQLRVRKEAPDIERPPFSGFYPDIVLKDETEVNGGCGGRGDAARYADMVYLFMIENN
jgi:hypothetical protein